MRMFSDCLACLAIVRLKDVQKLFKDEDSRLSVMSRVIEMLKEMAIDRGIANSPRVATAIFRWLKRASGVDDPYADEKRLADLTALKIYEEIIKRIKGLSPREKLLKSVAIAAAANALDLGVAVYQPPRVEEVLTIAESNPPRGIDESVDALMKAKRIIVVLDNAGEAVLDRVLADTLKELGKEVIAIVKSGAFQNDETINDVKTSMLNDSFDDVIESGTDAASIFLDEVSPRVLDTLRWCDLIISKGMANYEYLSDVQSFIGKPIVYILMAKCRPIAENLGVKVRDLVAKILYPTA